MRTDAQRQAIIDAQNYLQDCDYDGTKPSNDVSAFGGWDGWAIEGTGVRIFAMHILPAHNAHHLDSIEDGDRPDDFKTASAEYHAEFSRVVAKAIAELEDK